MFSDGQPWCTGQGHIGQIVDLQFSPLSWQTLKLGQRIVQTQNNLQCNLYYLESLKISTTTVAVNYKTRELNCDCQWHIRGGPILHNWGGLKCSSSIKMFTAKPQVEIGWIISYGIDHFVGFKPIWSKILYMICLTMFCAHSHFVAELRGST